MRLIMNPGRARTRSADRSPRGPPPLAGRRRTASACSTPACPASHARLDRTGEQVVLVDLGSKNGTFVQDLRVATPRELSRRRVLPLRRGVLQAGGEHQRATALSHPGAADPLLAGLHGRPADAGAHARQLRAEGASGPNGRQAHRGQAPGAAQGRARCSPRWAPSTSCWSASCSSSSRSSRWTGRPSSWWIPPTGTLNPRVARLRSGQAPSGNFYSQHIVEYVRHHSVAALFADAPLDPRLERRHVGDAAVHPRLHVRAAQAPNEVLGVLYVDNLSRPTASAAGGPGVPHRIRQPGGHRAGELHALAAAGGRGRAAHHLPALLPGPRSRSSRAPRALPRARGDGGDGPLLGHQRLHLAVLHAWSPCRWWTCSTSTSR